MATLDPDERRTLLAAAALIKRLGEGEPEQKRKTP